MDLEPYSYSSHYCYCVFCIVCWMFYRAIVRHSLCGEKLVT